MKKIILSMPNDLYLDAKKLQLHYETLSLNETIRRALNYLILKLKKDGTIKK